MAERKNQSIARAYRAADRARVHFWLIFLVGFLLLAGAALYYSYNRPAAAADNGKMVESPGVAASGAGR